MNAYIFLQHYWWFVVSLLGALLVFLLFVQGGNSLLFCLGKTEEQKKMMINFYGTEVGVHVYNACHVWRRVLCFVSVVL